MLDNYLEPEKIPLDVKTEEEEEDEFFEKLMNSLKQVSNATISSNFKHQ